MVKMAENFQDGNGRDLYMRCAMTQGTQEKRHFDFTTYGSGVIGQNVMEK